MIFIIETSVNKMENKQIEGQLQLDKSFTVKTYDVVR